MKQSCFLKMVQNRSRKNVYEKWWKDTSLKIDVAAEFWSKLEFYIRHRSFFLCYYYFSFVIWSPGRVSISKLSSLDHVLVGWCRFWQHCNTCCILQTTLKTMMWSKWTLGIFLFLLQVTTAKSNLTSIAILNQWVVKHLPSLSLLSPEWSCQHIKGKKIAAGIYNCLSDLNIQTGHVSWKQSRFMLVNSGKREGRAQTNGVGREILSLIFSASFTKSFRHCSHFSRQLACFVIASGGPDDRSNYIKIGARNSGRTK